MKLVSPPSSPCADSKGDAAQALAAWGPFSGSVWWYLSLGFAGRRRKHH